MTEAAAKVHLRRERISAVLCVVLLLLGITALVISGIAKDTLYRSFVSVSNATDPAARRASYLHAISIAPEKAQAYLLLLDCYDEDGIFEKAESEEFLSIYNANHTNLPSDTQSAQLHKSAGLLYINGYNDSSSVRLKMALPFFESAQSLGEDDAVVKCYVSIGHYYRDFIWTSAPNEVSAEQMTELILEMAETLTVLDAQQSAAALFSRLGFGIAACDLLYDQRNVLAATVPKELVFSLLDSIYGGVPSIDTLQTERLRQMAAQLLDTKDTCCDMIGRAYERAGRDGS